jgi:hypothetical protein
VTAAEERTMPSGRRVVFTFDERSFRSLEEIKKSGRFGTFAETVRSALQVNRALQDQVKQGFREVVVRNPKTNQERILVLPELPSDEET